jgi:hypothetical protein
MHPACRCVAVRYIYVEEALTWLASLARCSEIDPGKIQVATNWKRTSGSSAAAPALHVWLVVMSACGVCARRMDTGDDP